MKTEIKLFVPLLFVFLVLTQGCEQKPSSSKESSFKPTQNGFGVMAQWVGIDTGPGAELYYKGTNETPVQVWPCIGTGGYPILYTNDIALLLADKPDGQGRMGNGALIVIQGTGPAMDISQDVLKIASEQNHMDFKRALQVNEPLRLNQFENEMKIYFVAKLGSGGSDLEAKINWKRIFDIMQDVRKTGQTNKVVNTEVMYLQKDYDLADGIKIEK